MLYRSIAASVLACAVAGARAQVPTAPTDFPAEAKPLTAETLQLRLSGKVFNVKTAGGAAWRLQFQPDGFYFVNVGNYSDSGRWRTEESGLCTAPQRRPPACNQMRLAGDALYMQRDSGEIVKYEPN